METETSLHAAEDFLHSRIPLTRTMGLRVIRYDAEGFVLEAPVSQNSNHLGTAFGGSINAVATLAAYGLLWMELRGREMELVVSESSIRFLRPIRTVIRAICARPEAAAWSAFQEKLSASGKARIRLRVRVEEANEVAAELEGVFVARRKAG